MEEMKMKEKCIKGMAEIAIILFISPDFSRKTEISAEAFILNLKNSAESVVCEFPEADADLK
ncbi:MAG: hypothetical protein WC831_02395 [Parcubacteria group bacterium]